MAKKSVKRPTYDGNTCILYDFMVARGLDEEKIAKIIGLHEEQVKLFGEESANKAPWNPVSLWLREPISIPQHYLIRLCTVLHAPIECLYMKSKILNGESFSLPDFYTGQRTQNLNEVSSDLLVSELKRRGFKVYKEV